MPPQGLDSSACHGSTHSRLQLLHHRPRAALSTLPKLRAADKAANKMKVAVVALGRGMGHMQALLALPDVEIAYLAETDSGRLEG